MSTNSSHALVVALDHELIALPALLTRLADEGHAVRSIEWLGIEQGLVRFGLELFGPEHPHGWVSRLETVPGLVRVEEASSVERIYGKRVIVIGGGAQVAQVAMGAVSEADRHNIRGERISVDTIPLVGEENLAAAVRAVAQLPRAAILVLAGSIMGGDITEAVRDLQRHGIPVVALNMVGTVPDVADLVVSDPVQAGVMAVMAVANTAKFDITRQKGRRY